MKRTIIIILLLILISSFLSGCKQNSLYTINDSMVIESSKNAYDYSYSFNDNWSIETTQNDNYVKYINNENEVEVTIIKIRYNNAEKGTEIESKELPFLFKDKKIADITFKDMNEKIGKTDYHGEFKFRYSRGIISNNKYQCIYFLSDNTIPSVHGEKVANCIVITYQNEKDKNIETFLQNIEESIHYE